MTDAAAMNAGAFGFGLIIGWYVYYVNRYRKGDVQFSDVTTLVGAIGGAAILALFEAKSVLFGYYGMGLAVGFFSYFVVLLVLVYNSDSFTGEWFLDGRRKNPLEGWSIPGDTAASTHPMAVQPTPSPVVGQVQFFGNSPSGPASTDFNLQAGSVMGSAASPAMLPLPRATASPLAASIFEACKAEWSASKDDCNKFVKAVGSRFGVTFTGNADAIVGQIQGPHWTPIRDGVAAARAAREGKLVIGGMTSQALGSAHGHVVVVVDGAPEHDRYPIAYWGSLNPAIRENGGLGKGVNWSFSIKDRDHVVYAAREV